ncbi:MAG: GTP cyclohydrolase FolE2 [Candidatus Methylopumilus sp.]|nr:GTP cyclohydrolase FolE2 [Candidatus Methylopumilus sp.]
MNLPVDFSPQHLHPSTMEDVQNLPDVRAIAIDRVGIKGIRHPIKIQDKAGDVQHSIANFNMLVALPHDVKGTHMSRFVEILNENEQAFSLAAFSEMLSHMAQKLETNTGRIEMQFPYFVNKTAPVSGVKSLMDYEVILLGVIGVDHTKSITLKVLVPVTSLCPCSKKISNYGAHNQRSHVTVSAKVLGDIHIEDIIDLVESQASAQLYGLLKRPDEKYVTEHAYDNPKFVEDMVRDVAAKLNAESRVGAYAVECENFESIHNHSAFAVIAGKQ